MMRWFIAVALLWPPAEAERIEYAVSKMVESGLSREEAESLFQDPRLTTYPRREVAPRKIDWDKVIADLVAPASIRQGSDFLARYKTALAGTEEKFGLDRSVIAAVLRLESNFGKNTGTYVVFNVFYTLLSQQEEERRWRWAGDNLAALASFCKDSGSDCFNIRGSYGGALGAAQFLPYSLIQFGADGNGDGVVDPFNMEDAIASAANFLVRHGWHQDQTQALGKYYGSSVGYPRAILAYAEALRANIGISADNAPSP